MRTTPELSNKIANMSFVCACLVVCIHVPDVKVNFLDVAFSVLVKQGLSIIAVPVFFVIAGYFLGRHVGEDHWYAIAVKKRIKTLLVPFFVLNLIWFPVKYGVHYVGVRWFAADASSTAMELTLYNFLYYCGILPWGGNVVTGLWFVRALFYLIIISPVIVWMLRRWGCVVVFVMLALWCLQTSFRGDVFCRRK